MRPSPYAGSPDQSGFYWYALFRNPETGERNNKKSVRRSVRSWESFPQVPYEDVTKAIIICQKALDEGIIFGKREPLSLYSYLKEFFDWDTSPYVERRNLLDPGSISKDYIATRQNLISNHILPRINTNLLLSTVTLNQLEQIQLSLVKEGRLASSTINICMGALSLALGEAQRCGLLPGNRTYKVRKLKSMHKAEEFSVNRNLRIL